MASKYWIKLYHDVLDDPKMGRLPDNIYKLCIELFLYAGELDTDGHLPCSDDIAWRLRRQPQADAEFFEELEYLERVNIIERTQTGWLVTQFANRQAPVNDAERARQYRKRQVTRVRSLPETKRNGEDNGAVTFRDTDKIRIDTDKEGEKNALMRATSPPNDEDEKQQLDSLLRAVADICCVDSEHTGVKQREQLSEAVKYIQKFDATVSKINRFGDWWPYDDPPYLKQVISHWPRFEAALKKGVSNGLGGIRESIIDGRRQNDVTTIKNALDEMNSISAEAVQQ